MPSCRFPALLFVVVAAGCGSGPSRPVAALKGIVQLEGKEVPGGTVLLVSDDGLFSCTASIDERGHFQTTEAPIGNVRAAVVVPASPRKPSPKSGPARSKIPLDEIAGGDDGATEVPEIFRQIPPKYRDPQRSGLSSVIVSGANEWNLLLKTR